MTRRRRTGRTARATAEPTGGTELDSLPTVERGVDAVERALSILAAFRVQGEALSLAELAGRTGLYKSTILRLSVSLQRFRLLRRDHLGRYHLGAELYRLGLLCDRAGDLEPVIRPALARLVADTGETASFYVRQGNERICLYRENSPRAVRHHLDEGARLPLDRGAPGRVLLASAGETGADYEQIRAAGYYISRGERDPEVSSVAVPVRDAAGTLRGALAVSGLAARFRGDAERAALAALRDAAMTLVSAIPMLAPPPAPAAPAPPVKAAPRRGRTTA